MVLLRPCYIKNIKNEYIPAETPKWSKVQRDLDHKKGEPLWNHDIKNGKFNKTLYKDFLILDIVGKQSQRSPRLVAKKEGTCSTLLKLNSKESSRMITPNSDESHDDDDD